MNYTYICTACGRCFDLNLKEEINELRCIFCGEKACLEDSLVNDDSLTAQRSNSEISEYSHKEDSEFLTALKLGANVLSIVDNWAGTPCPHCGFKSCISNYVGKKQKGFWDTLMSQTKVQCKNCGEIFVIPD